MKYYKDTNNNPFVFEDNVTVEIIAKVETTHKTTLTEITLVDYELLTAPTSEQLKELARAKAKQIRDSALQANTYSINTSVYQVRPQDLSNFSLAIQEGISVDWILQDNTVRLTTVAELQEILNAGIAQGKAIWNTYTNTLKGI